MRRFTFLALCVGVLLFWETTISTGGSRRATAEKATGSSAGSFHLKGKSETSLCGRGYFAKSFKNLVAVKELKLSY